MREYFAYDNGHARVINRTIRKEGIHFKLWWEWEYRLGFPRGEVKVSSMEADLTTHTNASLFTEDFDRLQHAWETAMALIDDPETAPDAVTHWMMKVSPTRKV